METHARLGNESFNIWGSSNIVNWLFERDYAFSEVTVLGSGPFSQRDFESFLVQREFELVSPSRDTEVLILGSYLWEENTLSKLVLQRSGKTLRVYSQEMFLTYLLTWLDPLTADPGVIQEFAAHHPGLSYLRHIGFEWPITNVVPSFRVKRRQSSSYPRELGLLRFLGYSVGKSSRLSDNDRRNLLSRIYLTPLVPSLVFSKEYIDEWGEPGSSRRLYKIARSIAAFCNDALRRSRWQDMSVAISHWQEDLAWLKSEYYDGCFVFRWPEIDVW